MREKGRKKKPKSIIHLFLELLLVHRYNQYCLSALMTTTCVVVGLKCEHLQENEKHAIQIYCEACVVYRWRQRGRRRRIKLCYRFHSTYTRLKSFVFPLVSSSDIWHCCVYMCVCVCAGRLSERAQCIGKAAIIILRVAIKSFYSKLFFFLWHSLMGCHSDGQSLW